MASYDPQRIVRPGHRRHHTMQPTRTTNRPGGNVENNANSPYAHPSMTASTSSTTLAQQQGPASRFISTVRRSLSVSHSPGMKRRHGSTMHSRQESNMFSTSTELSSGHFRRSDRSASPPTVEQIAMGLHLSRTPHLRQTRPHHSLYGKTSDQGAPHNRSKPLPPPPARSSLKNGGAHDPGLSTASSSTVASTVPSTPHSIHSSKSLRAKMARFLPLPRSFSAPQSLAPSPDSSSTDFATPKKAVRFSPEPLARPAEEH